MAGDAELVVNERFVLQYLDDLDDPLDARLELEWLAGHVVGIARDVETELGEPALPKVYVSMGRVSAPGMSLTVRAFDRPASIVPAVRREIEEVDPDVLIEDVAVIEQSIRTSVAPQRFNMWLLVSFASLALALAAVGIHGVTAYSVASRRGEIGIRRALGANDRSVAVAVARRVAVLTAVGIGLGMARAVTGAGLVQSLLVGVTATEPLVLAGVALLLVAVAASAASVPVVRALAVDPTEALRSE